MATKTKLAKSTLPKGYTQISATAENHDWDASPILEGVIKRIDSAKIDNEMRKVMHIEDAQGDRQAVWESAGLRALFECNVGDRVYVQFTGFGEQKDKKKNPPRLYEIGVQREEKPM